MSTSDSTTSRFPLGTTSLRCPACGGASLFLVGAQIRLGVHEVEARDTHFVARALNEDNDDVSLVVTMHCGTCERSHTMALSQGGDAGVELSVADAPEQFGAGDGPFVRLKAVDR